MNSSPSSLPSPIPIRPFGPVSLGAPTGEEAASFDRWAIEAVGVPRPTLMENAGRGAAAVLQRLYPEGEVLGLVGSGNNGGDALVLLRTLASWGRPVTALLVADRPHDDALLHGWGIPTIRDSDLGEDGEDFDRELDLRLRGTAVLVDGILGTGITGEPRRRQARAIRAVNRSGAAVLALDVPSGVDADTGGAPGESVEAEVTVAFGWPKLGTLLSPGRERAGRLVALEIGFPPARSFRSWLITPAWAADHRPRRGAQAHKYSVGSLLLHAGRKGMAGAAVMAGRAALRSGVGLLRIASDPENRVILQERVPEAIFVDVTDEDALTEAVESVAAVASGPGIGTDDAGARALRVVLEAAGDTPLVLDADALTLVGASRAPGLTQVGSRGPVLLTPHPGEMARISDASRERIRDEGVEVARELAESTRCAVLLKGLPSVVASPGGVVLVDSQSTSALAAAGMGDVLTGVCGSFLAQGVRAVEMGGDLDTGGGAEHDEHELREEGERADGAGDRSLGSAAVAGALGLYHSGRGAVVADQGAGLTPEDVVSALPRVLRESGPGVTDLDLPFVVYDQDAPR